MIVPHVIWKSSSSPPSTTGPTPTYTVHHPRTGKRVHEVQASTLSDIRQAIKSCHMALPSWSAKPISERCDVILRAAALLDDPTTGLKDRLRDANRAETDISDWWSQTQVDEAAESLRALLGFAEEALRKETVRIPGCESSSARYFA